ncbi:MAG: HlyC/CorC family transporter [Alphaproteobacteria bacterium]
MESEILWTLAAIGGLIVLSGFFSGSETALTAASRARLHQAEKSGDSRAATVNRLRDNPDRLIGTILLGNNLVNILASALATNLLVQMYGPEGVALATVAMTLTLLVFAEVLPKTVAFSRPYRLARLVAPLMLPLVWLLAPFSRAVNLVVLGILKVLGLEERDRVRAITEEELRGAIDLHRGEDLIVRHERLMLQNILDLEEVEVGEIMTHRTDVVMIDADGPADKIVSQVASSRHTRIPVYRGTPDNIIGILHAKALMGEVWARQGNTTGLDIAKLASKPWFVPDSSNLFKQLEAFRQRREHFAVVVDEYGAFEGVVTLEDILEEIVGDIIDEYDTTQTEIRPQPDGSYLVLGSTTLRDLNRHFEWSLPDEDATTIAGLLLHEARQIPEVGQVFEFHGLSVEVMRRRGNQITALRLTELLEPRRQADDEPAAD